MTIAIGIGCKRNCSVDEIIELIHTALEKADIVISEVDIMATAWVKEGAENVQNAAEAMDLPLIFVPKKECDKIANLAQTISQKVVELYSIPSVAEVSALAVTGNNPKLILPRINSNNATCAIAVGK